ncbi:MAG TPA: PilZ domain-containing protein [Phycisphaerae bacterium]|nr:PilZ domain-containing protein [Phycisphaerae bacterium]
MSQVLYVSPERRDQIIAEAASRQTPVVLTRHNDTGWTVSKTRFAGCDQPQRHLFIESPDDDDSAAAEMGELLGVAFRRGHKKCLFNSVVAAPRPAGNAGAQGAAPIMLRWPDGLQELQRRVYQRACPPPDRRVKVVFSCGSPGSESAREYVGVMEDLSAGGIRVRSNASADLPPGGPVCVSFALRSSGPQFVLDATFRHREPVSDGAGSFGFQFVGLETSREGQETLARLARTVTDFQRAALRRRPAHLRQHQRGR